MGDGAARATVNYELAQVRRSFKVAIEKGILTTMPVVRLPKVSNARTGFFEESDVGAVIASMPPDLADVVRFLVLTGWRKSEALDLTWDQVDLDASVIRLAAQDTKAGVARLFSFAGAPELQSIVSSRLRAKKGLFVFHRDGERIGDGLLRGAWRRACKQAGLEGRLIHDLRRTSARELRRAGVSEGEVIKLCGWQTRAMFDRYNIIDEEDLARAVARRFNGKQAANNATAVRQGDTVSSSGSNI